MHTLAMELGLELGPQSRLPRFNSTSALDQLGNLGSIIYPESPLIYPSKENNDGTFLVGLRGH